MDAYGHVNFSCHCLSHSLFPLIIPTQPPTLLTYPAHQVHVQATLCTIVMPNLFREIRDKTLASVKLPQRLMLSKSAPMPVSDDRNTPQPSTSPSLANERLGVAYEAFKTTLGTLNEIAGIWHPPLKAATAGLLNVITIFEVCGSACANVCGRGAQL